MLIRFVAKSDRLIYFQGMEMRGFPASLPEFQPCLSGLLPNPTA
jgi:hypothetical protein